MAMDHRLRLYDSMTTDYMTHMTRMTMTLTMTHDFRL